MSVSTSIAILPSGTSSLARKQLGNSSGGAAGAGPLTGRGSKRGKLGGAGPISRAGRGRGASGAAAAARGGLGSGGYRSYFNYQQQAVQVTSLEIGLRELYVLSCLELKYQEVIANGDLMHEINIQCRESCTCKEQEWKGEVESLNNRLHAGEEGQMMCVGTAGVDVHYIISEA